MPRARIGAILPHAPLLLLDETPAREQPAVERVRAASRALADELSGTLMVLSPHARETGVYLSTRGGLRDFGLPRADASFEIDVETSARIGSGWRRPMLSDPLDHGVTVPLGLLSWRGPVVAIGIAEGDEPDLTAAASSLAEVLASHDATVIASVNGGAGVTPRAPLTEVPGGLALEEDVRRALGRDLADLEDVAPRLAGAGGSCALAPLLVLSRLFPGVSMDVRSYEWPFGVSYPVAITKSPL